MRRAMCGLRQRLVRQAWVVRTAIATNVRQERNDAAVAQQKCANTTAVWVTMCGTRSTTARTWEVPDVTRKAAKRTVTAPTIHSTRTTTCAATKCVTSTAAKAI